MQFRPSRYLPPGPKGIPFFGVLFDYKLAGTVLGYSSAVASYGAFIIPAMFGVSISVGKPEVTLFIMAGYYTICGFVNFYFYTRPGAERHGV